MTANAYERISFRGRSYDRITAAGHEHWEYCLGKLDGRPGPVRIETMQGPFSTIVSASGNTHAGSGAEDNDKPAGVTWGQLAWAGRLAGWFASVRLASQGRWSEHVHAVQLGNTRVSSSAALQIANWENYDDAGLVGNDKDAMRDPDPFVGFHYPMVEVDLDRARAAFKKPAGPLIDVKRIQRTLNLKTGTHLVVDGTAGPKSRRALGAWEQANGGDGDGLPGELLWLLGAARFEVVI